MATAAVTKLLLRFSVWVGSKKARDESWRRRDAPSRSHWPRGNVLTPPLATWQNSARSFAFPLSRSQFSTALWLFLNRPSSFLRSRTRTSASCSHCLATCEPRSRHRFSLRRCCFIIPTPGPMCEMTYQKALLNFKLSCKRTLLRCNHRVHFPFCAFLRTTLELLVMYE